MDYESTGRNTLSFCPIHCLYLKKAISVKVKTIYDREKQLSVFILWMAPYGKIQGSQETWSISAQKCFYYLQTQHSAPLHGALPKMLRERTQQLAWRRLVFLSSVAACCWALGNTLLTALTQQEHGIAWQITQTRPRCGYCIPQLWNCGIQKLVEVISTVDDSHQQVRHSAVLWITVSYKW